MKCLGFRAFRLKAFKASQLEPTSFFLGIRLWSSLVLGFASGGL